MTKKKRGHPGIEEVLARPWCYYCERDFDDQKILLNHQKAKHFKCDRCGRRLNTAGGLSVHMNQVHKETLTVVENALPNRSDPSIEIFGMVGIPDDIMQQHQTRVTQQFYEAEAERRAVTGNPPAGAAEATNGAKRAKIESADDIKKRLAEFRAKKAAKAAGGESGDGTPTGAGQETQTSGEQTPTQFVSRSSPQYLHGEGTKHGQHSAGSPQYQPKPQYPGQQSPAQPSFPHPYGHPGYPLNQQGPFPPTSAQPGFGVPPQQYPQFPAPQQYSHPGGPPPPGQFFGVGSPQPAQYVQNRFPSPQNGSIARPPSLPTAPGLPQRPSIDAPTVTGYQMQQLHHGHVPGTQPTNQPAGAGTTQDPRLRSQQAKQAQDISVTPNDVDDLISDAAKSAGTTSTEGRSETKAAEPVAEKKSKKDNKETRLVYTDGEVSPEEKMAKMSKYAFDRTAAKKEPVLGNVGNPMVTGTVQDEDDVMDPAD